MGILDFFRPKQRESFEDRSIYTSNKVDLINESFKGNISQNKVKFPEELGIEHPFNFEGVKLLAKNFGIVSAIVDKHVDFIFSGGMNIKSEDDRAMQIIEDFIQDTGFDNIAREWVKEALFGNGFLEIAYDGEKIIGIRVLASQHMYIEQDEKGSLEGYNQFLKDIKNYNNFKDELIHFSTKEIAHLPLNKLDSSPYGYGIIQPSISLIDNLLGSNKEMHTLMERKANSPLFILGGDPATKDYPKAGEVASLGEKLENMNNKHEWVLSAYWKPTSIDFGNVGDKFSFIIDNDKETLYESVQIPAVLMGKANVPEGLAKVQMESWMFRITSLREEIEKVIEEKIFKVVLNSNGIDEHVEIVWGVQSQDEKIEKVTKITELLKNPFLNEALKIGLEKQLADIFEIPEEDLEEAEEERKKEEEEEPQPVVPGQRAASPSQNPPGKKEEPKEKPQPAKKEHIHEHGYTKEQIEQFNNMTVQEWVGFNYQTFKEKIISFLRGYNFEDLKGITATDFKAGLLRTTEIEKMRNILEKGFKEEMTIREIEKNLNNQINFKNRLRLKDGKLVLNKNKKPILSVEASKRAIMIARTETVRAAGQGAIKNYKEGGITKVRWIASLSERTCPICEGLNGQIFPINNPPDIPAHVMCRCVLAPVVE